MYIDVEDYMRYCNVNVSDTTLQELYVEAAEDIVEIYLGRKLSEFDIIPGIIRLTIMRIAALIETESNGNIGVTSKTVGDSGTRTFIKTTDYDPYLIQISHYKKV